MKTKIILTVIILNFFHYAFGLYYSTDSTFQVGIGKLQYLTGKWKGSGWMMGRDGQRHFFNQTEEVQFKLDSTLILIEGMGKSEGTVIHHAFAVVSFNKSSQNYTFQSYLPDGKTGSFTGELIGEKFHWYPNENIRYIIGLNEKGQWHETGEMKRDEHWFQFFEMTLDRED